MRKREKRVNWVRRVPEAAPVGQTTHGHPTGKGPSPTGPPVSNSEPKRLLPGAASTSIRRSSVEVRMSKRKSVQIECSVHGALGCECMPSFAKQKSAKHKKRSRRRSDQQRARGRVEREGSSYREALFGPKFKKTSTTATRSGPDDESMATPVAWRDHTDTTRASMRYCPASVGT